MIVLLKIIEALLDADKAIERAVHAVGLHLTAYYYSVRDKVRQNLERAVQKLSAKEVQCSQELSDQCNKLAVKEREEVAAIKRRNQRRVQQVKQENSEVRSAIAAKRDKVAKKIQSL